MLNLIFFQFLDEVAKIQEQAIIEEQKRLKAEQDAKQRKLYTRKRTETEQSAGWVWPGAIGQDHNSILKFL